MEDEMLYRYLKPADGLPGPYGFLVTSASPSAIKHHGGVALSKHEHIEILQDFSRAKQSFLQKFALQQHQLYGCQ